MWNPFHKRDRREHTAQGQQAPRPSNRVDELASTLERQGRPGELERELQKLDLSSLSTAEQESWWHLFGIVAFQEGRDAEALSRFKEGHDRFPRDASRGC